MNILLQNKSSLKYVEWSGGWTTRTDGARVFDSGLEAMFYCFNNDCTDMQILGEFADVRMNFTVPVTNHRRD